MKPHLPSRLRSALLTALASVSIPTLTAASLVTFSTQAAAEYMPDNGSFKKEWTTATPTEYKMYQNAGTTIIPVNIQNVKVTGQTSSISQPQVQFITSSTTDRIYYADIAWTSTSTKYSPRYYGAYGTDTTGPKTSMTGSMYMKNSVGGKVTGMTGASYVNLSGSVYMELNGAANYSSIYGANSSIIGGSCTMVITAGTFNGTIACFAGDNNTNLNVTSGTFLEIDSGTFNGSRISAGGDASYLGTINGGTHLLITNGTFKNAVCAGSYGSNSATGATVNDGVHACIKGGSFSGDIYGGAVYRYGEINDGIDFTITGGAYSGTDKGIYASGNYGNVNSGSVSLTLRGDDASFADNYVISAGGKTDVTYGEDVTGRVTLADLTEASSLIKSTSAPQGIQVKGLATKDTVLEMSNVKGTLNAALSGFTSMEVKDGSMVTLTQALNETLGGAKTVNIAEDSSLTLESAEGEAWNVTVEKLDGDGSLYKTGEVTLIVSGDSSGFTEGSVVIDGGTMEVQNNMNAKTLSGSGKLAKTGEGKMSVTDASDFTGDILATGGTLELEKVGRTDGKERNVSVITGATVNLLGVSEDVNVSLHELVIDNGTLGVYVGGTPVPGENEANVGVLTLAGGSKIVVGGNGGTLEANLTTECDSILDFTSGGVLTMGCELDVQDGTKIAISSSAYESLMDGNVITLFTGVDNSFCVDVTDYVTNGISSVSAGGADPTKVYLQTMEGGAVVLSTTANTPEPTTATLSLLALAGLAARRRRSKAVAA